MNYAEKIKRGKVSQSFNFSMIIDATFAVSIVARVEWRKRRGILLLRMCGNFLGRPMN